MLKEYFPILLQLLVACGFATTTLLLSVICGKSAARTKIKDTAYECGMLPVGEAQARFSVKFYLIAMLFVLFDIEVVFLYPWAVIFRESLGSALQNQMFWGMTGFVGILGIAYIYALKKGAFRWQN